MILQITSESQSPRPLICYAKISKTILRASSLGVGGAGVDGLSGVLGDGTDGSLGHQGSDGLAGKGAVNPQAIAQDGGGDHLVLGDLVEDLVVGGLVEQDHGVDLLLHLTLRPLLLLLG